MLDKPALTLLHLGPGFANSMANQHNARRARVPLVNMVGDHADYHLKYDAPLTSDVPGHAGLVSDYVRVSESADDLAQAGAEAVQAALHGAGSDALEQAQHGPHAVGLADRRDQVHFGGARVGEADLEAGLDQGLQQVFGSVHAVLLDDEG
jgi:hypothetical protein